MVSQATLQQATDRIVEKFRPQRIILFGSHARGTADERSDVDLLVVASFTGKRRTIVVEMDRALRGMGLARDIILLTPEEFNRDREIPGTIARPAAQEGKILYERH